MSDARTEHRLGDYRLVYISRPCMGLCDCNSDSLYAYEDGEDAPYQLNNIEGEVKAVIRQLLEAGAEQIAEQSDE